MEGFFSREEEKKLGIDRNIKTLTCDDCGLYKNCNSPKMALSGEGRKKVLIIAEAPGKEEDVQGTQLVGKTGRYFRKVLKELGYDLDRDFWKMNAINCRPPKNRNPKIVELNACRPMIEKALAELQPRSIITLGKYGWLGLMNKRLSGRISSISISGWVGERIPDQEWLCWICPTYHPAYIVRNDWDEALVSMWKSHLDKAVKWAQRRIPVYDWSSKIEITEQLPKAIEWLREIKGKWDIVAFDYETTGLKPHRRGHQIVAISFSNGEKSYAFPYFENDSFRQELETLLRVGTKLIGKIAQNFRFEDQWTQRKLGYSIRGWDWDTLLGAHCIDNRKPTGLKFQVYVKFGILGYDSTVDRYIEGKKKGEDLKSRNAFNLIQSAPMDEILKYNAADSLFTYWLAKRQKERLKGRFKQGALFLQEGSRILSNIQAVGIRLDEERLETTVERLNKRLKRLYKQIIDCEEAEQWDGPTQINPKSDKQLRHLLFHILKLDPIKTTEKGQASVDEEVLEKIDIPFTRLILEYRRWKKAKDTYLAQYSREMVGDIIHPFFNLHNVKTFRSSSDSPNFQNVPKRDKRVMRMIRSVIIPRKGNRLIEWDYKGVEVAVAACYNKDPNLIEYVSDPTTDMHRDTAADLFLREKEDVSKDERDISKNGFVFPTFYGDYFEQTAPIMWDRIPEETKRHLRDEGVKTLRDFLKHVEEIERIFWKKKFPVYAEWKKKSWKDYQRKGYVDLYTGFRCYAPMTKNEVTNYQTQGSAFHCLLWSLNQIEPRVRKNYDSSFIIGQIHDAIVGDVNPKDEAKIDSLVWKYGTQKIREHWDWIVVPLTITKEVSEINGNWANMKEEELKG